MFCQKCMGNIPWDPHFGMDNGLRLELDGGYGEFIDAFDGPEVVYLCHECAHELADFINLDVSNWHTHRPDSGQHADHYKWSE